LRFSLLFERFLNPERVSMPDFDIDFCQDRREEVIRYVQQPNMAASRWRRSSPSVRCRRARVLRDVGRVLEMPYGQVDKICKLVPNNPANPTPLSKAIEEEPKLQEEATKEPVVARLLDIAQKIEGFIATPRPTPPASSSATGRCRKLVPMYRDPRSDMPVTQFNMKWVEQAGLVKFDFLGLKTLTVLKVAVKISSPSAASGRSCRAAARRQEDLRDAVARRDGRRVPGGKCRHAQGADRHAARLHRGHHRAGGALSSGPDGEHPDLQRPQARRGREIESIHPKIDYLLKETQGVIVYQEQVMQIAQVLSGYSLGEADLLRRAMGKKIKAEMDQQRERFVDGAVKNGVSKPQADNIFDLLAKFANYGFNKSHAAAYAIVSYQTAYLKAHYPGRVPRRVDDARHGEHRKGQRFPPGCQAARHRGHRRHRCRPRSASSRPATTASITRWLPSRASANRPSITSSRCVATSPLPASRISACASIRSR
jgi:DNA polymerase-3 subunit alpha